MWSAAKHCPLQDRDRVETEDNHTPPPVGLTVHKVPQWADFGPTKKLCLL